MKKITNPTALKPKIKFPAGRHARTSYVYAGQNAESSMAPALTPASHQPSPPKVSAKRSFLLEPSYPVVLFVAVFLYVSSIFQLSLAAVAHKLLMRQRTGRRYIPA
jgi:hypothetical protein